MFPKDFREMKEECASSLIHVMMIEEANIVRITLVPSSMPYRPSAIAPLLGDWESLH